MAALAVIAVTALGGCAGAVFGNPQGNAGITHAEVKVCESDGGTPYVCGAEIVDGKEKQNVKLTVEHPDGWKVRYAAAGVTAFEGQKIRGAVEEAVSEDAKAASPGIVDKITSSLVKLLAP